MSRSRTLSTASSTRMAPGTQLVASKDRAKPSTIWSCHLKDVERKGYESRSLDILIGLYLSPSYVPRLGCLWCWICLLCVPRCPTKRVCVCSLVQVERRVFVNNIIVRFHPELELEGDEVKTIICRYPSPKVIPPPAPPVAIM